MCARASRGPQRKEPDDEGHGGGHGHGHGHEVRAGPGSAAGREGREEGKVVIEAGPARAAAAGGGGSLVRSKHPGGRARLPNSPTTTTTRLQAGVGRFYL